MKIALYVHCFFPAHYHGTETYTLILAKNLLSMGHEPVVVSGIFEGEKRTNSPVTRYNYQGIPVYCIDKNHAPLSSLKETYFQPQVRHIHLAVLKEICPDIIHVTHLINHTATLLEVAKDQGIPIVATFTDFFGFCFNNKLEAANGSLCSGPNPQRTNCLACFIKDSVRHANWKLSEQNLNRIAPAIQWGCTLFNKVHMLPALKDSQLSAQFRDLKERPELLAKYYRTYRAAIAPTRFLQSAYEKNGLAAAPLHQISFGVDLDRSPKQIHPASVPIRFGFIGQIAPHKGTSLLVEAFCRLQPSNSELHIFGAEDQSPSYTRSMKERCINFPVFFRGTFPPEQMRQVLDEIDFLVIPSTWYENSPLVLLNALASHTPVIVSDVAGLTEFLEKNTNGYSFIRGSIDDLERVMRTILTNPQGSRQLSLTTNYLKTTLSMTQEVVAIYNSIVTGESA